MKKRFKKRKKLKFKNIYLIIVLIFLYFFCKNINFNLNNNILDIFLSSTNRYKSNTISDKIYTYFNNNIFNNPANILKNELNYTKKLNLVYVENERPIIYIYNSHQDEKYSTKYLEDYNIVPDVLMVSSMLKDKLDSINVTGIVENSDILKYMKSNNLKHSESYIASRIYLENAISEYPNALLYIDLHRDSSTHKSTTTTINNKECAKILFVIGLEYDTYEKNLNIVNDLNNIILNKYPNLTRGIMKKSGYGVNGVYNQDLKENVILIEIGSNENNIEEVNNTLDLLVDVIGDYINEKEEKE